MQNKNKIKKVLKLFFIVVMVCLILSGNLVLGVSKTGTVSKPDIVTDLPKKVEIQQQLFSSPLFVYPTGGDEVWNMTYGGSYHDQVYDCELTDDGGYILTGYYATTSSNVWLIKTNEYGVMQWSRSFGDLINPDIGNGVQQTIDGGFIIAGQTRSYGAGYTDAWLIKTDTNGYEEWNYTFGGSDNDTIYAVQETQDEGFILTGYTYSFGAGLSDLWLIKTDTDGTEEWNTTFGGSINDRGEDVWETINGDFICTGYTGSYGHGGSDLWLICTNDEGVELWNQTYGGSLAEAGCQVKQTSDNGFIAVGYTQSFSVGWVDVYVVKTDSIGTLEWEQTYGGISEDRGFSIEQTYDAGYILTGRTDSFGIGNLDAWVIKINDLGDEMWNVTVGGINFDSAYSVHQTYDGGYIAAGTTGSYGAGGNDGWLIKFEPRENKTFYVDAAADCPGNGTMSSPYCKVQIAIDRAIPGDIVLVGEGVYYENIVIDKKIELVGLNHDKIGNDKGRPTYDGQKKGPTIEIKKDGVTIKDCIIKNGTDGIYSKGHNKLQILNNIIWRNEKEGINLENCGAPNGIVTISENRINNNKKMGHSSKTVAM